MSSRRIRVVFGSILGAIIIQVTLVVCSGGGLDMDARVNDGIRTADAAPPSGCVQWQVQGFLTEKFERNKMTILDSKGEPYEIEFMMPAAFSLPEGWEPFAGEAYGATLARTCIKYAQ